MEIDDKLVEAYRQACVARQSADDACVRWGTQNGWGSSWKNPEYLALEYAHEDAVEDVKDAEAAIVAHIDAKLGL